MTSATTALPMDASATSRPTHRGAGVYGSSLSETSDAWTGPDLLAPTAYDLSFGTWMLSAGVASTHISQTAAAGSHAPVSDTPLALYLTEPGDSSAISVYDINQGQIGDCFLLSSIGEIALFHPSLITQMIQANADGTETVTLYELSNGQLPNGYATSFKAVTETVTNTFLYDGVNYLGNQDVVNGEKEIWVQVLEKAVATLCGDGINYSTIAAGGCPFIAMEELTGCAATYYTQPGALSLQQLQSDVAAGDLITFDTMSSNNLQNTLAYGMYGDHAYMFESLTTVNGTVMVNLLNPWGIDQPAPIPFSRISSVCDEIDVDPLSKTVNTGPTLTAQTGNQTWTQGSHVSLALAAATFTELSGEKLTYTAMQASGQALPSWLNFNASRLTFSGTVPSGIENLSLTVTATDTDGKSCAETFQVSVPAASPVLAHQTLSQTWTEGAQVSFVLPSNTFSDPNGETLSYVAILSNGQALPSWLTLNGATFSGTASYPSDPLSIKVTATDTSGLSASETFRVTLAVPAPTLTAQTASPTWTAGQTLSFALPANTFTAVQGQTLRYTATLPTGLTINASTGAISGTVPVALGTYTIKITATETAGLSASETFKASVTGAAPAFSLTAPLTWTANKGVLFSVASAFSDPQGETLTYTAALSNGQALPAGLTFNRTTGTFGGKAPTTRGAVGITVTAKDQSGLSASETFQAVVVAQAPTLTNQTTTQTWTAGKTVAFTLPSNTFADPQGETLKFAATQADGTALPSWLKENPTTGALSGTAPVTPETLGITITATDQSGLSVSETFSATIQAAARATPHAAPTAAAPTLAHQTANQIWSDGSSMRFLLPPGTFADPRGSALTYAAHETSGSDQTSWLHFVSGSDALTGTVPEGLSGTIGIRVVATDAYGLSSAESFGLTFGAAGGHITAVGPSAATELLALHG